MTYLSLYMLTVNQIRGYRVCRLTRSRSVPNNCVKCYLRPGFLRHVYISILDLDFPDSIGNDKLEID